MIEQGMEPMTLEQFLDQTMTEGQMSGGIPLPNDPTKPVNPFAPKPTGPTLPNRQMAAYGGIMGIETPKRGRVDGPGSYAGLGSWFQENIMDPLKMEYYGIEDEGGPASENSVIKQMSQDRVNREPQGYENPLDTFFKGKRENPDDPDSKRTGGANQYILPAIGGALAGLFSKGSDPENPEIAAAAALYGLDTFGGDEGILGGKLPGGGKIVNRTAGSIYNNPTIQNILYGKKIPTNTTGNDEVLDENGNPILIPQPKPTGGSVSSGRSGGIVDSFIKNLIPIAGGAAAGLFTKSTEEDTPGLPSDTTGIQLADLKKTANILDQKQGMAAGLNFLPAVSARKYSPQEMIETYATAANGGRIGYSEGTNLRNKMSVLMNKMANGTITPEEMIELRNMESASMFSTAKGMAEGGIMDLGGMEKDYRAEGGFVPIGKQEKADDVPARLSVNVSSCFP